MSGDVVKMKPALVAGAHVAAIVPTSIEEAFRMAKAIAMAGWAPVSYLSNPRDRSSGFDESKIVVGIMHGLELGMTPIAALQSIAVINGTPSLWGDGALAVVQASGLLEDIREEPMLDEKGSVIGYQCVAKRRGMATPITQQFTLQDAARAKLLEKSGPWQEYRNRMLQMRARAWTLRAGFADVLRGLSIAEEVQDIPVPIRGTVQAPTRRTKGRSQSASLDAFAGTGSPDPESSGSDEVSSDQNDSPPEGAS